jgi:hypothetical protein
MESLHGFDTGSAGGWRESCATRCSEGVGARCGEVRCGKAEEDRKEVRRRRCGTATVTAGA